MTTITIPTEMTITIDGEERTIAVSAGPHHAYLQTGLIFLCRHPAGKKLYPVRMRFWPQADGSFKPSFEAIASKKKAQIVAWRFVTTFQVGQEVVRTAGDYAVGRVGLIVDIAPEQSKAQVAWTWHAKTWVSFNAIEPTSVPYEIQYREGVWPLYKRLQSLSGAGQ